MRISEFSQTFIAMTTPILRVCEWIKNAWLNLVFPIKPEPKVLIFKCNATTYWAGGNHSQIDEIRKDVFESMARFQVRGIVDRAAWEARIYLQKKNGSFYELTSQNMRLLISRDTYRVEDEGTEDGIRTRRVWELNRVSRRFYHLWKAEYLSQSEYFELQATGKWEPAQLPSSEVDIRA